MITVIHGDNHLASRNFLHSLVRKNKQSGTNDIIHFEGKSLDLSSLIQSIESQSLFASSKLVIIENLFSQPQSQRSKNIIKYLQKASHVKTTPSIIIWEKKALSFSQLKSLGSHQQNLFKIPSTVFKFLDSLQPGNARASIQLLEKTLENEPPDLVFSLLIRQIHLLIQVKTATPLKLKPWQMKKLTLQASKFTSNQLIHLQRQLLYLDNQLKAGNNLLSLKDALIFLIINI